MLSCRDVTDLASEYLDGRVGTWQRVQFRLHLLLCVHCRRFVRQLRMTIGLAPSAARQTASDEEIEAVLERIRRTEGQPDDASD